MARPGLRRALTALAPRLAPVFGTALAYALVGWLAVQIALPPSYAAPLYPSSGIALACLLTWGWRALPGVFIGAVAVNLLLSAPREQSAWVALLVPVAVGLGAALQAAAGRALVRRGVRQPMTLGEPRDLLRFFLLGGLLACCIGASVSVGALFLAGTVGADQFAFSWWTWWAGDTLGVLIGAPVAATFIGRPRSEWAPRRLSVGLPLTLVTLLLGAGTLLVARLDERRSASIFEHDALHAADLLEAQLREPLAALQALQGVVEAAGSVDAAGFAHAARPWLQRPLSIQAMGLYQAFERERQSAFEEAVRQQDGRPAFRVFEREPVPVPPASPSTRRLALRYIAPEAGNQAAIGLDPMSVGAVREALERARASAQPAATRPFRLTQEVGDQMGVVVYQVLWPRLPPPVQPPFAAHDGVVFVTLRMDDALRSALRSVPAYLQWCLIDPSPGAPARRLAGAAGCDAPRTAHGLDWRRDVPFAGQRWQLQMWAHADAVPELRHWNALLFSLVGLIATALLGALLLFVTGRARRIEAAVAERTADLQREVSERERTEVALRESERRFRNILDAVPIGVLYTDLDGRIRESNPRLREMLGHDAGTLTSLRATDLTHPEDRPAEQQLIERLLSGDIPGFRLQKRVLDRHGGVRWCRNSVSLLRDSEGRPMRMVAVLEDITEHLRLEEAERARESAEAASRAKSDFVSRMSHELRTPLNAMLGFAQLLELDRQQPLAPHQLDWTTQIQQAGWHLLHMINDTLDFARIESGSVRLELAPVALPALVADTRALLKAAAEAQQVTVVEDLDPAAGAVLADGTRLKQVLTNLLSNAIKYNRPGGWVRISSRPAGHRAVEIRVQDNGIGLSASQLGQLFQPFNRLGRDRVAEGTGIGLVISRRLAELMGGSLQAEAGQGGAGGATFRLVLPAAPEEPTASRPVPVDLPGAPPYRRRMVHYIEDNETNAEVMRGILAQRPQVALQVSTTGLDGLAAVRRSPPSLILLDMQLPDLDGLELLRHLKADPLTRGIPVVVVSADATAARMDQAGALGAAGYVTKPVNVAEMLGLVDSLLLDQDTHFGE
ncbi:CHASE domain-containing protein [Aquabacterium sp. J223]|uniref:CHASE domain-containing protein n=1 Tax=Aquabacterium sp. J223 TaxID=2898431 RepID=UPI0021AE2C3F|nr:CHASE domain-containing protein [Aquabacterium sp. J223]UUX96754.1 CHASE domain-containing protein [Aquabacterium sp. J223]